MGNCGGCSRTTTQDLDNPVLTKYDRVDQFEANLPFKNLYIDEYESLVMAVARIQKINHEYKPPLRK